MDKRQPPIPMRTSSKRHASDSHNEEELRAHRDGLNREIFLSRKMLKPHNSFNYKYWNDRLVIARKISQTFDLTFKIKETEFLSRGEGDKTTWLESAEYKALLEQQRAAQLDAKLCAKHERQLTKEGVISNIQKSFVELYTTSKNGLNVTQTGMGKRDRDDQDKFRAELIRASNSAHPQRRADMCWCPVTSTWYNTSSVKAAHIFAYHHGQPMMSAIFGDDANNELFSVNNGMIMCPDAEERFDQGYFVIVPDVSDNPSRQEIEQWNTRNPQGYRIKVLDFSHQKMQKLINLSEKTWKDLDGQPVTFRSNLRPRARYLYFHYVVSVLRRSWHENQHWKLFSKELGKKVWATRGRYLKKAMLLGFASEVGHDVMEAFMNGCVDPSTDVQELDETALLAANDQIRLTGTSLLQNSMVIKWDTEVGSSVTLAGDEDEDEEDENEEDENEDKDKDEGEDRV